jgi:hypothetical protein
MLMPMFFLKIRNALLNINSYDETLGSSSAPSHVWGPAESDKSVPPDQLTLTKLWGLPSSHPFIRFAFPSLLPLSPKYRFNVPSHRKPSLGLV